jgi:DNA-binding MarR family transcriptional regulator
VPARLAVRRESDPGGNQVVGEPASGPLVARVVLCLRSEKLHMIVRDQHSGLDVDRIAGLSRRFQRALDETLAEFDLDYAEYKLLGLLTREGEVYRSSPGKLARMMELSSGAMTNRLDRLEQADLVRRLPDPNDRRGIQVELTARGKRLYEDAVGVQGRKESLVAAALTNAEKKQLNALLRRLMIEFERAEGGPPPEDC